MIQFINRYLFILCVLSLLSSGLGLYYVFYKSQPPECPVQNSNITSDSANIEEVAKSFVYINGAVKHPGVYPINANSRVYNILQQAGGIASGADISFISKSLNISSKVVDEEFLSKPPEYAYVSDSGRVLVSGIPVDLGDWIFIDVDIYGKTNFAVVCAETFNEYYEVVQP